MLRWKATLNKITTRLAQSSPAIILVLKIKQYSDDLNLKWDSINSNTFQDQAGQTASFKYGSLSNTSKESAMELGPQAKSLVDLGHHAPNVNIEMIVSRLIQFKKLGGFHFNDSKYGDDDLDSGSLHPYQQFLIFNELVDAEYRRQAEFAPNYMLDQSHNVTDPIESLMNSAASVQRSYVSALIVDREKLTEYQQL